MSLDDFDPNNFTIDPTRECRVYGDDLAQTWCVVSPEDYQWAVQWKWHINEPHPKRKGQKRYFRSHAGWRTTGSRYLHVEIMKRSGKLPPSEFHTMVDHKDGDEWNCTRENLKWATVKQNNLNRRRKRNLRTRCCNGTQTFAKSPAAWFWRIFGSR